MKLAVDKAKATKALVGKKGAEDRKKRRKARAEARKAISASKHASEMARAQIERYNNHMADMIRADDSDSDPEGLRLYAAVKNARAQVFKAQARAGMTHIKAMKELRRANRRIRKAAEKAKEAQWRNDPDRRKRDIARAAQAAKVAERVRQLAY